VNYIQCALFLFYYSKESFHSKLQENKILEYIQNFDFDKSLNEKDLNKLVEYSTLFNDYDTIVRFITYIDKLNSEDKRIKQISKNLHLKLFNINHSFDKSKIDLIEMEILKYQNYVDILSQEIKIRRQIAIDNNTVISSFDEINELFKRKMEYLNDINNLSNDYLKSNNSIFDYAFLRIIFHCKNELESRNAIKSMKVDIIDSIIKEKTIHQDIETFIKTPKAIRKVNTDPKWDEFYKNHNDLKVLDDKESLIDLCIQEIRECSLKCQTEMQTIINQPTNNLTYV